MKVCVILPTLNEEKAIVPVMENLPHQIVDGIVIVDGYSRDNTIIVAKDNYTNGIEKSVIFQDGYGKGAAFQSFLNKFDLDRFDIYVMLDADNTYDPRELSKVVRPIVNGEADVVMGNRLSEKMTRERMSNVTVLGNRALTLAANVLYMKDPKDVCTGYWAFSRDFLKKARIRANGFDLEANLFTEAVKKGFRLKVVPIRYSVRIGDKKLKYSDGLIILLRLLEERFRIDHLNINIF